MAKSTKRAAPAAATVGSVAAPTNVTAQGTAVPQVIVAVKAGVKFRGARAAWYAVLQQHVGKPAADFLAATTAQPPSVPKSGIAEKSSGWLSYFTRTGVAQVK
jgi:hypothetical protein